MGFLALAAVVSGVTITGSRFRCGVSGAAVGPPPTKMGPLPDLAHGGASERNPARFLAPPLALLVDLQA